MPQGVGVQVPSRVPFFLINPNPKGEGHKDYILPILLSTESVFTEIFKARSVLYRSEEHYDNLFHTVYAARFKMVR